MDAMLLPYQRRLYVLIMALTIIAVAGTVFLVVKMLRPKGATGGSAAEVVKRFIIDMEGPMVAKQIRSWRSFATGFIAAIRRLPEVGKMSSLITARMKPPR
jgi:hypothetical protein